MSALQTPHTGAPPRRRRKRTKLWASMAVGAVMALTATTAVAGPSDDAPGTLGAYEDLFLAHYEKIKDPASGYFSEEGIPYHSIETLMVEAPDHGHETTSEAYSYLIWLEAVYGKVTEDWAPFNEAWGIMEQYVIPTDADQPTNSFYDPSSPATYAPELDDPSEYPSQLNSDVAVGQDPIAQELSSTYGTDNIYGMHWLQDVDNVYGYGNAPGTCSAGPDQEGPSYINTFQRGAEESTWETVPHPTCDNFTYGGENGYLDLFTGDASYAQQWKYTNAPDADARAVQAAYWANKWAAEQGNEGQIAETVEKASKMGDYLRYSQYDKYFKKIGDCTSPDCSAGSGKDSNFALMSWYYAWGGATDTSAGWAWRIGSSHAHFGYQNPMAAYALSEDPALIPDSPTAGDDWAGTLERQMEFYSWLQSSEGAIAGGATNSWNGRYDTPPSDAATFYGMYYTENPVYHDPGSNTWFGMQAWSMQRVAELYRETGNATAKALLDKWVPWVLSEISYSEDGDFQIPATLDWEGQPDDWTGSPSDNANLHVTVVDYGQDVGITGSLANTLANYAAAAGDADAEAAAKGLLDALYANQDDLGIAVPEVRKDFERFDDPVFVPEGWSGTMPNGDEINSDSTFTSIRSFYQDDPDWQKVQDYLDGGEAPTFTYHRFWAQVDAAVAVATYADLFETD